MNKKLVVLEKEYHTLIGEVHTNRNAEYSICQEISESQAEEQKNLTALVQSIFISAKKSQANHFAEVRELRIALKKLYRMEDQTNQDMAEVYYKIEAEKRKITG